MAGLKPALYFPYIDLEEKPLWGLLLWFRQLVVLQPSFSCLSHCAEEAQRLGWLEVKQPLALSLDNTSVRALLREWERLGQLYQDSGYLRYLQHGGLDSGEEPGWSLVKKIREYGRDSKDHSPEEETLRGQLLLQMAQELDRQRREIQEELLALEKTQARMLVHLGVEEVDLPEGVAEPLPALEQDDFLIPQRVRAWAEMLAALEEGPHLPLLTPNRLVLEHLVEKAMEDSPGEPGSLPLALMQLELPMFSPSDGREVANIRKALEGLLPWKTFCEKMDSLLEELPGMEAREIDSGLPRARALAAYFQQEVREALLERVTAMEPRWKEGWRNASLQVVVLPGWEARGLASSPGRGKENLVIMHLEESPEAGWASQRS